MRIIAAIALLPALAACQDLRTQRKPEASGPDSTRLEARIIGLTEEVDRLARRVAALEGNPAGASLAPAGASLAPATAPRAERVPAAAPPGAMPSTPPPTATAAVTGILIDARSAATDGEKRPSGTRHDRWRVLDFDGGTLFSSGDLPEGLRRVLPVFWLAGPADDVSPDVAPTVGASPRAVTAAYAEIFTPADGPEETIFYIDAASVSRIRALPDFRRLLSAGRVAIILDR
jgi:hypothetical protein